MERKIKICEVTEITASNGNKFTAFKSIAKGGRKMDTRFVRECENVPKEKCIIVVNEEDCNVDNSREYPILWVKRVLRCEPFEKKTSNIGEYFD